MRGSFASTGAGHGTDKALVAGLMGMAQDDPGIRRAFELAREAGMEFEFHIEEVAGAHPNSVRVVVEGDGRTMEAVGYSIGGGAVLLHKLDGFQVDISCALPAVIIMNKDVQGVVSAVTSYLSAHGVNIATIAAAPRLARRPRYDGDRARPRGRWRGHGSYAQHAPGHRPRDKDRG